MVSRMFQNSFFEVTLSSVVGPNRDPGSWRRMMVDLIRSVDGEMGIMGMDRA
jgi:hypothetical protein